MAETKNITRQFIDNAVWAIGNKLGIYAIRIGVLAVTARFIAPDAFGEFAVLTALLSFGQIVSSSSTPLILIQRREVTERFWRAGLTLNLAGALLVSAVYLAGAGPLAGLVKMPQLGAWIPWLGVLVVAEGFSSVFRASVERELRVKQTLMVELVAFVVSQVAVVIPLAIWLRSLDALLAGLAVQTLIGAGGLWILRKRFPLWPCAGPEMRELLSVAVATRYATIANFFGREGDNLIVGRFLGAEALGFYARAYNLMSMPAQFVGDALQRALLPYLCRRGELAGDTDRVLLQVLELLGFASVAVTAFVFVQADLIVRVLLGPEWTAVGPLLQILALGTFLRVGHKILDSSVASAGAFHAQGLVHLVYSVLMVGCVWAGSRYGVNGAALGALTALAVHYFLLMSLACRQLGIVPMRVLLLHGIGFTLLAILVGIEHVARLLAMTVTSQPLVLLGVCGVTLAISATILLGIWIISPMALESRARLLPILERATGLLGKRFRSGKKPGNTSRAPRL